MLQCMKVDEELRPVHVALFRAQAVVQIAQALPQLPDQPHRLERRPASADAGSRAVFVAVHVYSMVREMASCKALWGNTPQARRQPERRFPASLRVFSSCSPAPGLGASSTMPYKSRTCRTRRSFPRESVEGAPAVVKSACRGKCFLNSLPTRRRSSWGRRSVVPSSSIGSKRSASESGLCGGIIGVAGIALTLFYS